MQVSNWRTACRIFEQQFKPRAKALPTFLLLKLESSLLNFAKSEIDYILSDSTLLPLPQTPAKLKFSEFFR
jgi:hypothetical protein